MVAARAVVTAPIYLVFFDMPLMARPDWPALGLWAMRSLPAVAEDCRTVSGLMALAFAARVSSVLRLIPALSFCERPQQSPAAARSGARRSAASVQGRTPRRARTTVGPSGDLLQVERLLLLRGLGGDESAWSVRSAPHPYGSGVRATVLV